MKGPLEEKEAKKTVKRLRRLPTVWLEGRCPSTMDRAVVFDLDRKCLRAMVSGVRKPAKAEFPWKMYNITWRIWEKEPKNAEMKAAEWGDDE